MKSAALFLLKGFIIFGIIAYMGVVAFLFIYQRELIFVPNPVQHNPHAIGFDNFESVTIPTRDGERLMAWYKKPEHGGKVILFFHGNGGELSAYAPALKELEPMTDGFLAVDFRGYGGSSGQASAKGLLEDALSSVIFLEKQGISTDRIIVVGFSIGTGLAVHIAAQNPVSALVLLAPYTSLYDLVQNRFPFIPPFIIKHLLTENIDVMADIGAVKAPLLVVHGMADGIIPYHFGKKLFDAAPSPVKRHVALDYQGHEFILKAENYSSISDFLKEH